MTIEFSSDKISRDVSLNWNVNVGLTKKGVREIVILDAKAIRFVSSAAPSDEK